MNLYIATIECINDFQKDQFLVKCSTTIGNSTNSDNYTMHAINFKIASSDMNDPSNIHASATESDATFNFHSQFAAATKGR